MTNDAETLTFTRNGPIVTAMASSGTVSGTVTRTLDARLRTGSVQVTGSAAQTYTYDADDPITGVGALTVTPDSTNGRLTGTSVGVVTTTREYYANGDVHFERARISGADIFVREYTLYDSAGRIKELTETAGSTSHHLVYTYDANGRLTDVSVDGTAASNYGYDANGNRNSGFTTSSNAFTTAGTITDVTTDNRDMLRTYQGTTYGYDTLGRRTSATEPSPAAPTTYGYDALGNLTRVTLPNATQIGYVLDPMRRRIARTLDGSVVQRFVYLDALHPAAEVDATGTPLRTFVYGGTSNTPELMIQGSTTYRIITDHLGSPRLVIDTSTGTIVQQMAFDEFGNVTQDTNPGFQPFGFAGGLYDRDTGLTHFGAREYDARVGRWLTLDPIGFRGMSSNLYGYVLSDPIKYYDPTGLFLDTPPDWFASGVFAAGLIIATNSLTGILPATLAIAPPIGLGLMGLASLYFAAPARAPYVRTPRHQIQEA